MKILIAKQNQDIIRGYVSNINFYEAPKNTCFFRFPESNFQKLYNYIKQKGYNPFAIMYW